MAIDIRNKTKVQKSSRLAPQIHLLTKSRSSRPHRKAANTPQTATAQNFKIGGNNRRQPFEFKITKRNNNK
jgi:hypothetical protein